jgi:phosphinothricin acetyltransferase
MTAQDWDAVQRIYAAGIATGHATFEAAPPDWEHFTNAKLPDHRLVATVPAPDGRHLVVGWAALSPVSERCVYAGVAEHSVYVAEQARGQGIGRTLLEALLTSAHDGGIWTVQSGVFPENTASIALHTTVGFRVVGSRERIGRMSYGPLAGQWRDVVLLEHRAP